MYWMCKGISSGFAEVDEDAMTANERRRLRRGSDKDKRCNQDGKVNSVGGRERSIPSQAAG